MALLCQDRRPWKKRGTRGETSLHTKGKPQEDPPCPPLISEVQPPAGETETSVSFVTGRPERTDRV